MDSAMKGESTLKLCQKFCQHYQNEIKILRLDEMARTLNTKKRRLSNMLYILTAIGLISCVARGGMFQWKGMIYVIRTIHEIKRRLEQKLEKNNFCQKKYTLNALYDKKKANTMELTYTILQIFLQYPHPITLDYIQTKVSDNLSSPSTVKILIKRIQDIIDIFCEMRMLKRSTFIEEENDQALSSSARRICAFYWNGPQIKCTKYCCSSDDEMNKYISFLQVPGEVSNVELRQPEVIKELTIDGSDDMPIQPIAKRRKLRSDNNCEESNTSEILWSSSIIHQLKQDDQQSTSKDLPELANNSFFRIRKESSDSMVSCPNDSFCSFGVAPLDHSLSSSLTLSPILSVSLKNPFESVQDKNAANQPDVNDRTQKLLDSIKESENRRIMLKTIIKSQEKEIEMLKIQYEKNALQNPVSENHPKSVFAKISQSGAAAFLHSPHLLEENCNLRSTASTSASHKSQYKNLYEASMRTNVNDSHQYSELSTLSDSMINSMFPSPINVKPNTSVSSNSHSLSEILRSPEKCLGSSFIRSSEAMSATVDKSSIILDRDSISTCMMLNTSARPLKL